MLVLLMIFLAVVRAGFLPASRKMQTKLQVAPHPVRMAAFKKLGKKCWQGCREEEGTLNYMAGGSANDYSHYGTQ